MPHFTYGVAASAAWTSRCQAAAELEAENGKLKKLLAEAILDKEALSISLGENSKPAYTRAPDFPSARRVGRTNLSR